ncbi:hypothetical protein BJ875DRAFT_494928 [Amylocarpus encephaloides]|uniref:Uncharacterized protein n=1 Tax=Amylocarpus encephaloides TaxID=45428 RepID=A0A9P7YL09_9HELO|nr:hypothetical protein BJ875DRAFT_494928 [Amylocarpus encephaloides]
MEKRKKDTCHTRKDSIGDYCWFFNDDEFKSAMRQYCESRFGIPVIGGFDKSYPAYLPNIPDGKGGHQTFWGNIRVDRAAPGASITDGKLLAPQQCYNGMIKVFETCKGYGGWWNDGWGTFFAECIRQ